MKIHAEKVDVRSIAELVPYARNSRTHSPAQIKQIEKSIQEFGWTVPVLVDEAGTIIAGHGRVMAASNLGIEAVPVVVAAGWTDDQKRAYIIADNKIASNADWDKELLALELSDLKSADYDLGITGFNAKELVQYVAVSKDGLTDEDEVPEPLPVPVSASGDVWLLGAHRVMCGDSTSMDNAATLMDGVKADMVFTSPPYGAGNAAKLRDKYERGKEKRKSFYGQHEDKIDEWHGLMNGWYNAILPHADTIICNVQMLADNKIMLFDWLHDRIENLVDVVIWDKINAAPQMQKNILGNAWEFIFIFGGNGSRTIPLSSFHGTKDNFFRLSPRGQNDFAGVHRAVMPTDLALWAINDLCVESKIVADPFGGTGTTLIACEKTGRACRMMELDPKYVDVIVKRWQAFTGKQAVLESNGKTFDEIANARH